MAKVYRMRRRSHAEIVKRADKLESHAADPNCQDDPAWVQRRAERMRQFAYRRSKAYVRKTEERRKNT
jgi:hypothetical protein